MLSPLPLICFRLALPSPFLCFCLDIRFKAAMLFCRIGSATLVLLLNNDKLIIYIYTWLTTPDKRRYIRIIVLLCLMIFTGMHLCVHTIKQNVHVCSNTYTHQWWLRTDSQTLDHSTGRESHRHCDTRGISVVSLYLPFPCLFFSPFQLEVSQPSASLPC